MAKISDNESAPADLPADLNEIELRDLALTTQQVRYFRVGDGAALGRTGAEDLEAFSENLSLLQDCSIRMGNLLEMEAVSHCVVYEKDSTIAYRYDPDSNPRKPMVVGAMVNRHLPIRKLLADLAEL